MIVTMKQAIVFFFTCPFSHAFWNKLHLEWNNNLALLELLMDGNSRTNLSCFKEVLLTGCWSQWNHRNKIIFDGQDLDLMECFSLFKETFALVMHRAKPSLKEGMQQWVDTL